MNLRYFPYFRGRQFELLAIRELVSRNLLSSAIIPIVEPVKLSSTLLTTFQMCARNGYEIALVRNPEYGDVIPSMRKLSEDEKKVYRAAFQTENVFHVILQNSSLVSVCKHFRKNIVSEPNRWIAVFRNPEYLEDSIKLAEEGLRFGVNLIPDNTPFRRGVKGPKVLFRDCFLRKDRNVDYSVNPDELFSDYHTYAAEENYVGTGDYSIIGSEYSETGFAPYAVAIHIVYEDSKKPGTLRIRHFVSDSNDGYDDPAGKFREAAEKMSKWVRSSHVLMTNGLRDLINAYDSDSYPGLGSIKKFSIMHHLELMGQILSREG